MSKGLKDLVYLNMDDFPCNNIAKNCNQKERTISYALFVKIPKKEVSPEIVFKECCYTHHVLASKEDKSIYKNDYTGFYHKKQLSNERADFYLIKLSDNSEIILNDSKFGVFNDFGDIEENLYLKTFVLEWRKVLIEFGPGAYKVVKRHNIAGIDVDKEYLVYNLNEYSKYLSDKTVRIDVSMSGLLEKKDIDFTNSGFKTSVRIPGFFGRREVAFEEDFLIDRNYKKTQISSKQTNTYKFQTNLIPECITSEIYDFYLFSDDIRINDYNLNNHSYNYINYPVKYDNNEGTSYFVENRKAILNLVFNDKIVNNNKRNY